jgi:hypothetical protein
LVYERDLNLDLFATQRGRSAQGSDLIEGAGELSYSFDEGRTFQ